MITRIETLGFVGDEQELRAAKILIDGIEQQYGLTEAIIKTTIELRQQYKIKLPDAVIAATALHHHQILLTRNLKDFTRIESLVCENLHERT